MDLKEEAVLGDQVNSHWYYRAKAAALCRDLVGVSPNEVLDIGAGSGFFSRLLLRETAATKATCVDIGYEREHDETCHGKSLSFRRSIRQCAADLVLAMDVLEHVPDEAALMRPYIDLVRPGTRFIISVPAFQFLWSSHDVFLEHYRRYTIGRLIAAIEKCGLVLDWSHYYYASVFPIAAGLRLLERASGKSAKDGESQLKRHSPLANGILLSLCTLELPLMRVNKLFGVTVFAGCHKP
jgi:2-polyprenyl-3-methyl-5-hydroxy-6-metoxy-1,4-benzoquinol methylase